MSKNVTQLDENAIERASTKSQALEVSSESAYNIISNLGIMSALMASVAFSLILSISVDEFHTADIIRLSLKNPSFRLRFAPNSTLNVCQGRYEKAKEEYSPSYPAIEITEKGQGINAGYYFGVATLDFL